MVGDGDIANHTPDAKINPSRFPGDKNFRTIFTLFPTTSTNYKDSIASAGCTLRPEVGYRPGFQKEIHYGH